MMKITGLSHLFKWENLHNWWLTKYFFAPLYVLVGISLSDVTLARRDYLNKSCNMRFAVVRLLGFAQFFYVSQKSMS